MGKFKDSVGSDSNNQMCLCPVELSKKQNYVCSIQLSSLLENTPFGLGLWGDSSTGVDHV